ncbi:PD-(D/E)XK nuclease family protein [Candidatus Woesearchaeota archaeon]|nr:MAG: PD-(D/E)XK nuclease family protein [Candidatus Woesearchaeota archaeon]
MSRMQSPSSINTYKQCPRKYYYRYIENLPSRPSVHTLRGNAVHNALEDFFKVDIERVNEQNYQFELNTLLHDLLRQRWNEVREEFNKLGLGRDELYQYYMESKEMLQKWFTRFMNRLHPLVAQAGLVPAFRRLVPKTEVFLESRTFFVRGYIDAIYEDEAGVRILDYKTSKSNRISDEYRLQLSIYALLYQEANNGRRPDKVGIHFLKFGEESYLDVNDDLIAFAKKECQAIQVNTQSISMSDYPKNVGPLCKWATGQCDFFETCFGQITIEEARERAKKEMGGDGEGSEQ